MAVGCASVVLPRGLARFNRVATNKAMRHLAGRVPTFSIVRHIGRRSGQSYETPINVFRTDDGYVAALTYGPESDWVRNVLAAGGCELKTGPHEWTRCVDPRVVHDERRSAMPPPVRRVLAVPGATDFLHLRRASAGTA